jgi:hypothetical protein
MKRSYNVFIGGGAAAISRFDNRNCSLKKYRAE